MSLRFMTSLPRRVLRDLELAVRDAVRTTSSTMSRVCAHDDRSADRCRSDVIENTPVSLKLAATRRWNTRDRGLRGWSGTTARTCAAITWLTERERIAVGIEVVDRAPPERQWRGFARPAHDAARCRR